MYTAHNIQLITVTDLKTFIQTRRKQNYFFILVLCIIQVHYFIRNADDVY